MFYLHKTNFSGVSFSYSLKTNSDNTYLDNGEFFMTLK